ncbi:MAG: DoxX family protein [Kofleriaceae bacterium]
MNWLQRFEAPIYAAMRFLFGALFALHGTQKLFGFPLAARHPLELASQLGVGAVLELVCGALIAIGLFTRPAAFVASGMMAVAYFQFHEGYKVAALHWLPPVNHGEPAVMYCFVFLLIAARGAGRFALDRK